MRTAAGVIVGYLLFAVTAAALFQITNQKPHTPAPATFIILTTVYGMLFAGLGGYLAQVIARSRSAAPGVGVMTLIALGAAVSLIMTWREAAHWSQWSALIFMAPTAAVGGAIRRRQQR